MKRYDIIRYLIEKRGYRSYLEIGVLGNETFNSLPTLDIKHSVDPNGQATYNMTSDEFFLSHCSQNYDIIFIDGLHLAEQVTKDIENSLTHLNDGGIIVIHDCLPEFEWQQLRVGINGKPWTGDVWKAFANFIHTKHGNGIRMMTVDTDYGCGLIAHSHEYIHTREELNGPLPELTWKLYLQHRNQLMNVITVEEFLGRW